MSKGNTIKWVPSPDKLPMTAVEVKYHIGIPLFVFSAVFVAVFANFSYLMFSEAQWWGFVLGVAFFIWWVVVGAFAIRYLRFRKRVTLDEQKARIEYTSFSKQLVKEIELSHYGVVSKMSMGAGSRAYHVLVLPHEDPRFCVYLAALPKSVDGLDALHSHFSAILKLPKADFTLET